MLGRSRPLRSGLRRPTVLRFDSPLATPGNRLSPFGDGTYSGNIMQGGVVLQPQDYMLTGGEVLHDCIVVTGTGAVVPDWTTAGAATFRCHNLVLDGAAATLSASVNCKGLLGFVSGRVWLRNSAHLHMDNLGKAGVFGDLSPDMLLPAAFAKHVATDKLKAYVVKGRGAEGAPAVYSSYVGGFPAGPMQTGGGATGCVAKTWTGRGGCGGSCCGGAGAGGGAYGGSGAGGDFGGPGGYGNSTSNGGGGGAGDPPGPGSNGGAPGGGAGGGLLKIFARQLWLEAGCLISADGAYGGLADWPGGGAGGGCIVLVTTSPGGLNNAGTIRANGGGVVWGGAGSVNIFELKK